MLTAALLFMRAVVVVVGIAPEIAVVVENAWLFYCRRMYRARICSELFRNERHDFASEDQPGEDMLDKLERAAVALAGGAGDMMHWWCAVVTVGNRKATITVIDDPAIAFFARVGSRGGLTNSRKRRRRF